MSALICGSYAYDTIMVFQDHFKNHILPDQVHILNVSFLVPTMRKEFGGCAGNIAYNLKLIGGDPLPMATVGNDFLPYREWMASHGIDDRYVTLAEGTHTGQAFITTDLDDNQITAFHPGAMGESHNNQVGDATEATIGIVSPDGRDGMIEHAAQFAAAGVPFVFDPGQGLPMFGGEELLTFIDQATWVTLNDYESKMLLDRTGLTEEELADRVDALIITRGGEGSTIHAEGSTVIIPVVPASTTADPTGCGDAYRAGILFGLMNELDWATTGRIASLLGSIKIASEGTQNHHFTAAEFEQQFLEVFEYSY
ncbi:MAG: carbohydrate kinase family protein [Gammaproteobacteria bacterium]|nr:MAG: carbohydrate kinase family protein [Gammaproteobacteria bacterium]